MENTHTMPVYIGRATVTGADVAAVVCDGEKVVVDPAVQVGAVRCVPEPRIVSVLVGLCGLAWPPSPPLLLAVLLPVMRVFSPCLCPYF